MLAGLPDTIVEWESKGVSNEKIKPPITANHSLSLKLTWINNSKIRVIFTGSCLKQDRVIVDYNVIDNSNIINIHKYLMKKNMI